jgi:hypothetical protein
MTTLNEMIEAYEERGGWEIDVFEELQRNVVDLVEQIRRDLSNIPFADVEFDRDCDDYNPRMLDEIWRVKGELEHINDLVKEAGNSARFEQDGKVLAQRNDESVS